MSSAASMNQAIRQNRALQRKKSQSYFNNDLFKKRKDSLKSFQFKTPVALEVRRLQSKYQEERRKERIRATFGLVVGLLVCVGICYYLGVFPI